MSRRNYPYCRRTAPCPRPSLAFRRVRLVRRALCASRHARRSVATAVATVSAVLSTMLDEWVAAYIATSVASVVPKGLSVWYART